MNRRTDVITAERVLLALLIQAEFGTDAAVRYAKYIHLPARLVADVLARRKGNVRTDFPWIDVTCGRRRADRRHD